jgi:glycosyltransferase involved in cell wall biosynthesis
MCPRVESNTDNTMNCKISVIINIFNTEKYLRRCLDNVLAQTFSHFELILVDDCSTDGSPAICAEYAKKDRRRKVIHNTQNKGCPQARKTGLDAARGDYILFADSDDWMEPDMLELMYSKAVSGDLDIVYCGMYRNTDSEQQELHFPFLDDKIEMIKRIIAWQDFLPSVCNKLVKREIFKKIIFPTASIGEDIQISVQTIHHAQKIEFIKNILYHYYNNFNSLVNDNSKMLKRYTDLYEISLWTTKFISDNYSSYSDIFEPELSDYINYLKLHFVLEKSIRDVSKLHKLYPASNKHIFNATWGEALDNKVFLYLTVNHLGFLAYPAKAFVNFARIIYRLITPKKIRSVVWEKRMKVNEKV